MQAEEIIKLENVFNVLKICWKKKRIKTGKRKR